MNMNKITSGVVAASYTLLTIGVAVVFVSAFAPIA